MFYYSKQFSLQINHFSNNANPIRKPHDNFSSKILEENDSYIAYNKQMIWLGTRNKSNQIRPHKNSQEIELILLSKHRLCNYQSIGQKAFQVLSINNIVEITIFGIGLGSLVDAVPRTYSENYFKMIKHQISDIKNDASASYILPILDIQRYTTQM